MQVRWEHLTPPEFEKLAREETLCIVPIGSLERHGEHLPFGTDALVAHEICCRAAAMEPCVVFPPYWFGQVHEAGCFSGTINFPAPLLIGMLQTLLDGIAKNGFTKIMLVSGHGGNTDWLHYFMMEQIDREVDYTLYKTFTLGGERFRSLDIWDAPGGGHADERETSMVMAAIPGTAKMEQQRFAEPILPKEELKHLKGVHTGLWWYGLYPEHVSGTPSAASPEKGEKALEACALDLAEQIRAVKEDTITPALQKEFYARMRAVGKTK